MSNEHSDDITPIERPTRLDHATVRDHELRLRVVERSLKTWLGLAIAALTAAAGSLVAVGTRLYERGERDGAAAVRLDRVEHGVDRCERSVDQLEHAIDLLQPNLFSRRKDP